MCPSHYHFNEQKYIYKLSEIFYMFFKSNWASRVQCIFNNCSTSQFGLVTFQVVHRRLCPVANILESAALEFWTKNPHTWEARNKLNYMEEQHAFPRCGLWPLSALECTNWAKECLTALYILLDCVYMAQLAVRLLDDTLAQPLFCDCSYL